MRQNARLAAGLARAPTAGPFWLFPLALTAGIFVGVTLGMIWGVLAIAALVLVQGIWHNRRSGRARGSGPGP